MKYSEAIERVWRWKDMVYQDIKDMQAEQRVAYFKQVKNRLEEKTGVKLNLPHTSRHQAK